MTTYALTAAIFDMDGTLAETEDLHRRSWQAALRELGHEISDSDYYARISGRPSQLILGEMFGLTREQSEQTYAMVQSGFWRLNGERIAPLPGVERFLGQIGAWPKAVATGERRQYALRRLDAMGLRGHFAEIVTGDDVREGKPNPEIFLLAAARLGVDPQACVAFEDSLNGVKAARASGMLTIGLSTTHPAAALTDAHYVISDFDDPLLQELIAGQPTAD